MGSTQKSICLGQLLNPATESVAPCLLMAGDRSSSKSGNQKNWQRKTIRRLILSYKFVIRLHVSFSLLRETRLR